MKEKDKKYCMSSYLAFRYIEREDMDFYENFHHEMIKPVPDEEKTYISVSDDIDSAITSVFNDLKGKKLGLLLSGGMDSAILASYMRGCDAFTFRFLGGTFQKEELARAEFYAKQYELNLHYIDIDWDTVKVGLNPVMIKKKAPVHSIEPQLYQAAVYAKSQGVEHLIVGASSDLIFGGMDQLLAQDWTFGDFMNRYIFIKPEEVLKDSENVAYLFERYRRGEHIDFQKFLKEVSLVECSGAYWTSFAAAGIPYTDPYVKLEMSKPLDLHRIRHGESKYMIRELFRKKYPGIPVPDKIPMPRPVDFYFKDWKGPERQEFKEHLDMEQFTGNQKWQIYCLEQFLNLCEQ